MTKIVGMKDEHKRIIGMLHAVLLDLEYQQKTIYNLKLELPQEIIDSHDIETSLFAVRIHLADAHRWGKLLLDQVRFAQDTRLDTLRKVARKEKCG